jgi:hypothetical protein
VLVLEFAWGSVPFCVCAQRAEDSGKLELFWVVVGCGGTSAWQLLALLTVVRRSGRDI